MAEASTSINRFRQLGVGAILLLPTGLWAQTSLDYAYTGGSESYGGHNAAAAWDIGFDPHLRTAP